MLRKRVSYLSNGGQHFLAFSIPLSSKLVRSEKYHVHLVSTALQAHKPNTKVSFDNNKIMWD